MVYAGANTERATDRDSVQNDGPVRLAADLVGTPERTSEATLLQGCSKFASQNNRFLTKQN